MFILTGESIDESLNLLDVVGPKAEETAEHDQHYQEVKEEVKEITEGPEKSSEADDEGTPEDQKEIASDESKDLRSEEVLAAEGEYFDKAAEIGSNVFSGIRSLASFGGNVIMYLGGLAKELGIAYGPTVLSFLSAAAAKTLSRSLYLLFAMRRSLKRGYENYHLSSTRLNKRINTLAATLKELESVETTPLEPEVDTFSNARIFEASMIDQHVDPIKAIQAVKAFINTEVEVINQGMENDVRTIELLVENSRRGIRFSPIPYLKVAFGGKDYVKQGVSGYEVNDGLMDSFAYKTVLPMYCLPISAFPKEELIKKAEETENLSDISAAYRSSYMALGVSPVRIKSIPNLHYMDKKELHVLLSELSSIIQLLGTHANMFKSVQKRSERLKVGYEHYLHWYSTTDEQKSLRQLLIDIVHLKQHFVSKVYLPAMLDVYYYVGNQVSVMLDYAERSVRQIKPVKQAEE